MWCAVAAAASVKPMLGHAGRAEHCPQRSPVFPPRPDVFPTLVLANMVGVQAQPAGVPCDEVSVDQVSQPRRPQSVVTQACCRNPGLSSPYGHEVTAAGQPVITGHARLAITRRGDVDGGPHSGYAAASSPTTMMTAAMVGRYRGPKEGSKHVRVPFNENFGRSGMALMARWAGEAARCCRGECVIDLGPAD